MAGKFEALEELLDEAIELPVPSELFPDRKIYKIPRPNAKDGLQIEKITNIAIHLANGGEDINTEMLDDDEERDLYKMLLGEKIYQQMLDDKVNWVWLRHASLTVLMWVSSGLNTAEQFWAAAGNPELLARNRAERRQKQRDGSAAGTSTRGRASTSGTNRGRGTKGHRPRGTQKSPGAGSSKSGS